VARRPVALLLGLVLAHAASSFARDAFLILRSPWSRDYGEGCVLAMAQLLAERGNYFVALRDYPFLVSNYPPVFIGLTALAHIAFGPSLLAPRLLSLLATLALLAVLFSLLRRLAGGRWAAAALTVLFVAPWFVGTWAALGRVDMLALLFSIGGLAVVERHGVTRRAWPALPLFWLAFLTKQNALLAPGAVAGALLLERDRRAGRALVAFAVPLGLVFSLLVLATHGAAWRHMVPYTLAADYEWDRMAESYLELAVIAGPLLVLVAAALVAAPRPLRAGSGLVFLLYFLLNLAGLATIAKSGAAQNYYLEPWLATVLLAAVALRALEERFAAIRTWWPAIALAAAVAADFAYPSLHRLPQALRRPENAAEFVTLTRLVRETPGPILSENLSLLVVNRRPVLLEPYGILMITRRGLFRPDVVVRDCEAGRFALVVTEHRMWEIPGLGECLERRYEPMADLGPYQAFHPRPPR
jgi:4-amino-4-deoxy-L-arabinose transferase-like glycosyltransferase